MTGTIALVAAITFAPTKDDGTRFMLTEEQLSMPTQHVNHEAKFGDKIDGYNRFILRAVDRVQSKQMDGGGYFIGVKADPPESPIGFQVELWGKPLLSPPRTTSYCSGASYTAFITAINLISPENPGVAPERLEAMRMQEPDGSRREDRIKFWGWWNADGPGCEYALVQYAKMGRRISPEQARPGDFMNISWKTGIGHSVVFLGWATAEGRQKLRFWSSQKGTNGLGDLTVDVDSIKSIVAVRLTKPWNVAGFDPAAPVEPAVPGSDPVWINP